MARHTAVSVEAKDWAAAGVAAASTMAMARAVVASFMVTAS